MFCCARTIVILFIIFRPKFQLSKPNCLKSSHQKCRITNDYFFCDFNELSLSSLSLNCYFTEKYYFSLSQCYCLLSNDFFHVREAFSQRIHLYIMSYLGILKQKTRDFFESPIESKTRCCS